MLDSGAEYSGGLVRQIENDRPSTPHSGNSPCCIGRTSMHVQLSYEVVVNTVNSARCRPPSTCRHALECRFLDRLMLLGIVIPATLGQLIFACVRYDETAFPRPETKAVMTPGHPFYCLWQSEWNPSCHDEIMTAKFLMNKRCQYRNEECHMNRLRYRRQQAQHLHYKSNNKMAGWTTV
jgi:hypothetical protein